VAELLLIEARIALVDARQVKKADISSIGIFSRSRRDSSRAGRVVDKRLRQDRETLVLPINPPFPLAHLPLPISGDFRISGMLGVTARGAEA